METIIKYALWTVLICVVVTMTMGVGLLVWLFWNAKRSRAQAWERAKGAVKPPSYK